MIQKRSSRSINDPSETSTDLETTPRILENSNTQKQKSSRGAGAFSTGLVYLFDLGENIRIR
ncbi:hypothetical protein EFP84_08510 [Leptospira kmetyi]|uniref:Uncharacterized protein n=1 Tax=Leptospira kmetyi TaxID=408139 RepID=A0AAD0UQ12_9LEPT|nr:hypothetical protein EFP84_08510 [Leptospira kmetyi]